MKHADAVIIGSGALGAATAFYLARKGVKQIAVVDRHEIGSQNSPRAAGMLGCIRNSDVMIDLMRIAAHKIKCFSDETGQRLDFVQSGSLKVARRPEDATVLRADLARSRSRGVSVEQVSPAEAHRLHPFLESDGIHAVLHVRDDLYFDPKQVAIGYARSAAAHGVTLMPRTTVTRVAIVGGTVVGVETDRGTISSPIVLDAAGGWTRQVADASGIRIPLVPTRHQLFVTGPIEGARADLPMLRIMDAAVYMRPCDGGFLWGVFEEGPRFVNMDALGADFDVKDTPLDAPILQRAANEVRAQLPILQSARVREHRGGIPTMTADGQHIVGPAPAVAGFFCASGCNVAGLSIAPALGEALATWIVDGVPSMDLSALSMARFGESNWSEDELRHQAAWQYRHFYGSA